MRLVSAIYDEFYPFDSLKDWTDQIHTSNPEDLKEGDTLIVWGGADISPSLYNKPKAKQTWADDRPSRRDAIEWALMQRAKELGCEIIGVCRGAQMLCALAGGHLIQHVNGHGGNHKCITIDGTEIITNSIHHQMMYPWKVDHVMLASIKNQLSKVHVDIVDGEEENVEIPEEPEFVYFPKVKGYAIQWHPEAMQLHSEATQFVFNKIKELGNGQRCCEC